MFIPLLATLIPSLVGVVEKLIPQKDNGAAKKEIVQKILSSLYDKFLNGKLPDFPGVDEKELFMEASSFLIDFVVEHTFNKVSG
jgi:hypothetical protein